MKALLVIPALNEEGSLVGLLREIRGNVWPDWAQIDVVVVDDGSTDRTPQIAADAGYRVLRLCKNLGIGGAVQAGLKVAYRDGYACAVQVDGDGQHPTSEIAGLLEAYRSDPEIGMVIGSRYVDRAGFQSTFLRRAGARWLSFLLRLFAGVRCTDPTSGLRLYGKRALKLFDVTYPYDYPEPESLASAAAAGLMLREVAVRMRERQGGESSIRGFSAAYYMLKVSLAVLLAVLRSKSAVRR